MSTGRSTNGSRAPSQRRACAQPVGATGRRNGRASATSIRASVRIGARSARPAISPWTVHGSYRRTRAHGSKRASRGVVHPSRLDASRAKFDVAGSSARRARHDARKSAGKNGSATMRWSCGPSPTDRELARLAAHGPCVRGLAAAERRIGVEADLVQQFVGVR
jgi:hypothetical protein